MTEPKRTRPETHPWAVFSPLFSYLFRARSLTRVNPELMELWIRALKVRITGPPSGAGSETYQYLTNKGNVRGRQPRAPCEQTAQPSPWLPPPKVSVPTLSWAMLKPAKAHRLATPFPVISRARRMRTFMKNSTVSLMRVTNLLTGVLTMCLGSATNGAVSPLVPSKDYQ